MSDGIRDGFSDFPESPPVSAELQRAINALRGWLAEDAEGRVMTIVEDPSFIEYVGVVLAAVPGTAGSE